jgi:hypothetical protein
LALAFGVVASGVALASGQWMLFYLVALAVSYGLAVLFGRLKVALRVRHNGVGVPTRDLTERCPHNCCRLEESLARFR